MNASDYWRIQMGQATFNLVAPTIPANLYCRLYTDSVASDGTGTEVVGGSYVPALLPPKPAFTRVANVWRLTANLTFPTATAGWGTIVSLALWDASSGGNMIVFVDLDIPQAIATGQIATIEGGDEHLVFTVA